MNSAFFASESKIISPRRRATGWPDGTCILFFAVLVRGPALAFPSIQSVFSSAARHASTCAGVRTLGMRINIGVQHLQGRLFSSIHATARSSPTPALPILDQRDTYDATGIGLQDIVTRNAARAGAGTVLKRRVDAHEVL